MSRVFRPSVMLVHSQNVGTRNGLISSYIQNRSEIREFAKPDTEIFCTCVRRNEKVSFYFRDSEVKKISTQLGKQLQFFVMKRFIVY